jgi:hypothetical protein
MKMPAKKQDPSPGDWMLCENNVRPEHRYSIVSVRPGSCTTICDVTARRWKNGKLAYDPEALANAQLLSAARDMLEALRLLEDELAYISPKVFDEEISEEAKAKLKFAIGKAEGRKS